MGSSFLAIKLESLAPLSIEPTLKSLMYFWDLNKVALSLLSLLRSTLEEFHVVVDGLALLIELELAVVVTWPEMDFEGSR